MMICQLRSFALLILPLIASSAQSVGAADPVVIHLEPGPGPLANPLKGWCPSVDAGSISLPYSMVYHYVSWRELEPTPGQYDFEGWERRAWDVPAGRGKHVVFRVTIDDPRKPSGLPDWLRAEVKLTPYPDHRGGQSPDYENPALVAGLERLIAALGRRYDRDPRVAFVELGLLGHWGEWHTYPNDRLMASPAVQRRVITAFHEAFPHVGLMARTALGDAGRQAWLGFHDDMFPEDTDNGHDWSFLAVIRRAGRIDNWQRAPIGGEMVPGAAREWLGAGFPRTMAMVERSHFSWVGPYGPALEPRPGAAGEGSPNEVALVRRLGYQFRWTEVRFPAQVEPGAPFDVDLVGVNEGVAPFDKDWAVELALIPAGFDGAARTRLPVDVRTWLPGPIRLNPRVALTAPPGRYSLTIGIIDPLTGRPAVGFANRGEAPGGWFTLGPIEVSRSAR